MTAEAGMGLLVSNERVQVAITPGSLVDWAKLQVLIQETKLFWTVTGLFRPVAIVLLWESKREMFVKGSDGVVEYELRIFDIFIKNESPGSILLSS